jgi:hypothetical protein
MTLTGTLFRTASLLNDTFPLLLPPILLTWGFPPFCTGADGDFFQQLEIPLCKRGTDDRKWDRLSTDRSLDFLYFISRKICQDERRKSHCEYYCGGKRQTSAPDLPEYSIPTPPNLNYSQISFLQ